MKIKNVIIIIIIMTQINYKITARFSVLITTFSLFVKCGHKCCVRLSPFPPTVKNGKWAFRDPANNDSRPIVYCIVPSI